MSAILCGKRSVFEEHFFHTPPSNKRSRHARDTSPDLGGGGFQRNLEILREMFKGIEDKVIHHVLETCGNDIDSAILSLTSLRIGSPPENTSNDSPASPPQLESPGKASQIGQAGQEEAPGMSGPAWVDLVVQEMASAADVPDAKRRAANVLAAFERDVQQRCVAAQERSANEEPSTKAQLEAAKKQLHVTQEQLSAALKENHILKRAVAIQHERQREHESQLHEVQNLRQSVAEYQEQLRKLEVNNYALSLHLKTAHEASSSSLAGRFHPDVF